MNFLGIRRSPAIVAICLATMAPCTKDRRRAVGRFRPPLGHGQSLYSEESHGGCSRGQSELEAGQPFTFRAPLKGTLDYLLVYLWERTDATPKSVWTPMDVYREAVEGHLKSRHWTVRN